MTLRTLFYVLFLLISFAGCGDVTRLEQPAGSTAPASPTPIPQRPPKPPERIDRELESQIAEIASAAGGRVGVGAVMLETGDAAWLDRSGRFVSQSVYKLPIAMAVMKMVDDGRVRIDQNVSITPDDFVRRGFHSPIRNVNPNGTVMSLIEVVRYSISESDGTASDVLLDLAGGPNAVQKYLTDIGITDFIVADSEKSISKDWETQYRNWATPEASIELMRALYQRDAGISDWTTNLLLTSMIESDTGRRRLKRGLPEGAILAHKTGTGGRPTEVPGFRRETNSNVAANTLVRSAERGNSKKALNSRSNSKTVANSAKETSNRNSRTGNSANKNNSPNDPYSVTSATNDVGIITLPDGRHILIAVYVMDSFEDGWTRERVIADIAKAVCDRWSLRP